MNVGLGKCWLIGGTSDSAAIARQLSSLALPYVVTVATLSARELYPDTAHVEVGKLSPQLAKSFIRRHRVSCIADASHPFAREISEEAIALSQASNIPYLRYERPTVDGQLSSTQPTASSPKLDSLKLFDARLSDSNPSDSNPSDSNLSDASEIITLVDSIDALVNSSLLKRQRVLFTIGYRHLGKFTDLRETSTLYARVLPSLEAIAGAFSAGFTASEIIALRPPISLALEVALWQQWRISCVVAKASGQLVTADSGEQIKRQAAKALGVRLVIISRPTVFYPLKTEHLTEVVSFCQKYLAFT